MKRRHWIAASGLAVIGAVVAGVIVLFETPAGLHWAIRQAVKRSGGQVSIGRVQGSRLAGPVILENVRVLTASAHLTIHRLSLQWDPWALLSGTLQIRRLSVVGMDAQTQSTPTRQSATFHLPSHVNFPLKVRVEHLRLRDLSVISAGRDYRLTRLSTAFRADSNHIAIQGLSAQGPQFAVQGNASIIPHNRWPLHVDINWSLQLPGHPRVRGATQLHGPLLGRLQVVQNVRSGGKVRFEGTVTNPLDHPDWRGTLRIQQFDLHSWIASWPKSEVTCKIQTGGTIQDFWMHGPVSARQARRQITLHVALHAGWVKKSLRITSLSLELPRDNARLKANGTLWTSPATKVDALVSWSALAWPLAGGPAAVRLAAGQAHVSGSLNAWTITANTSLKPGRFAAGHWHAVISGNRNQLKIEKLSGRWLGGQVQAHGRLDLRRARPFDLTMAVRGVAVPSLAAHGLGPTSFNAQLNGTLAPLEGKLDLTSLKSTINGRSLTGQLSGRYAHQRMTVRSLSLVADRDRLSAAGYGSARRLKLDWHLQMPSVATFARSASGALDSSGRILGTLRRPRFMGRVAVSHLTWKRELSVASGHVNFDLSLGQSAPTTFDARLNGISRGDVHVRQLVASLKGSGRQQRFSLIGTSPKGRLELGADGRLSNGTWTGVIHTARLHLVNGPDVQLKTAPQVQLSRQVIALHQACWSSSVEATLCITGQTGPRGWSTQMRLTGFPLRLLNPLLAGGMQLQGRLDSTIKGQGGNGHLHLSLTGSTGAGLISRRSGTRVQSISIEQTALSAHLNDQVATAKLALKLRGAGSLVADAKIPWRQYSRPAGQLHLVANLPDLAKFNGLLPQVSGLKGRLLADVTVSGRLNRPAIQGRLHVQHGALTVPATGTQLTHLTASMAGHGSSVSFKAASSDPQNGRWSAQGQLNHQVGIWVLDATLQGHNFHAANMPELKLVVSPRLHLAVRGRHIKIDGRVDIPYARIQPPQFSQAVQPTPDLVIVGQKSKPANPWRLAAALQIQLGNDVRFQGYGLDAGLGGTISLHEQPGQLTTASGDINIIRGKYQAYGQDLTINRGRLLFSGGPVDNPGLDISASRSIGTVRAGLNVTGTLQSPQLQVFSDPPMSQSDALAYLLFGHGVRQTTGSQQNTFAQAANAIGIAGGTFLAKSLGSKIGIDTVSVQSASQYDTTAEQSSLFLGKYLSPRLYVSYGIGLFTPINLFRARYKLSRHWAVEAESGTISGADILFNISQ